MGMDRKSKAAVRMLRRAIAQLDDCHPFFRASVVVTRKPCVRRHGCEACKKGRGHHSSYLIASVSGKPKVRYLPKNLISAAKKYARNYRKNKALTEEMSRIWMEQFLEGKL
jgi:hypothetical protein